MKKEFVYPYFLRLLMLVLGSLITGMAIGLCNRSGLGADSITVFYDGFAKTAGISIGEASQWTAITMIILCVLVDWHQLGFGTVAAPFFTKLGIEIVMNLLSVQSGIISILSFILGLTLIAFGIAVMVSMNLGKSSYDALLQGLVKRLGKSYSVVRWIFDSLLLVSGFLMGGSITVGTFIAIWYLGKAIPVFRDKIERQMQRMRSLVVS